MAFTNGVQSFLKSDAKVIIYEVILLNTEINFMQKLDYDDLTNFFVKLKFVCLLRSKSEFWKECYNRFAFSVEKKKIGLY